VTFLNTTICLLFFFTFVFHCVQCCRMSKKVLIVLQTREISERRHQCLSIAWCGWKCVYGSQLQSYGTRHVFTVNDTKVTEFTYYKHQLFMINFVLSTFTRYWRILSTSTCGLFVFSLLVNRFHYIKLNIY
jgi:hypothetical protein